MNYPPMSLLQIALSARSRDPRHCSTGSPRCWKITDSPHKSYEYRDFSLKSDAWRDVRPASFAGISRVSARGTTSILTGNVPSNSRSEEHTSELQSRQYLV